MPRTVTCIDLDRKPYTVKAADLYWRPSAYGIVICDDKILLCKQFGKHNLPGGGIELGETSEEAVIREVKEETGANVTSPILFAADTEFFRPPNGDQEFQQVLLLYYVCEFVDGELSIDGFDEYEKEYAELAEWVSLDRVDDLQITSTKDFRPLIEQALKLLQ